MRKPLLGPKQITLSILYKYSEKLNFNQNFLIKILLIDNYITLSIFYRISWFKNEIEEVSLGEKLRLRTGILDDQERKYWKIKVKKVKKFPFSWIILNKIERKNIMREFIFI